MSMAKAFWVQCEFCEEGQFPTDLYADSARMARELARAEGWGKKGGKDICPECKEELKKSREYFTQP